MTGPVLFACNMNSVRSPMAAALLRLEGASGAGVDSAGVYEGGLDPFAEIVMRELGASLESHEPKTLADTDLSGFEAIIALTPEAAMEARRLAPGKTIEFWDVENPSDAHGGREAIVDAYRRARDDLVARLRARFPEICKKP